MKKQICMIMLCATAFICADSVERGRELGQDLVDSPVRTTGGILGGALGVVAGAAEETGEILTGDRDHHHAPREERQPGQRMRRVNRTYTQVK